MIKCKVIRTYQRVTGHDDTIEELKTAIEEGYKIISAIVVEEGERLSGYIEYVLTITESYL